MSVMRTDPVATAPLVAGGAGDGAGSVPWLGTGWAGDAGGETVVLLSGMWIVAGAVPAVWPAAFLIPSSVWRSENQNGAPWETRPIPSSRPSTHSSHSSAVSHGEMSPLHGC